METYLQRIDRSRNMHRFYAIAIERNLFDEWTLIRRWGRIGAPGKTRLDLHTDRDAACAAAMRLKLEKTRRGYQPGSNG